MGINTQTLTIIAIGVVLVFIYLMVKLFIKGDKKRKDKMKVTKGNLDAFDKTLVEKYLDEDKLREIEQRKKM